MPEPRRMFENGSVYFISNRLSSGLPFVCNEYINTIIGGLVARTSARFPEVVICGMSFMFNHYHAVIMLDGDPRLLASFMNDLHGELGKYVTRFLGKRNYQVWAQSYHAAKLGDAEAVYEKFAYMFLNPVAANLVDKVEEWEAISTWKHFNSTTPDSYKYVKPRYVGKLHNGPFTKKRLEKKLNQLEKVKTLPQTIRVQAFAWKKCFECTRELSDVQLRSEILTRIKDGEKYYRKERRKNNQEVIGAKALSMQNPHKPYKPSKFGLRVFCICSCEILRAQLISEYQDFCERCEKVWNQWSKGDYSKPFPPGAFHPPRPSNASLITGPPI